MFHNELSDGDAELLDASDAQTKNSSQMQDSAHCSQLLPSLLLFFLLCLNFILLFWGMGMFDKRSADQSAYRHVSKWFSRSMIYHLPHLSYDGNFTVQYVGHYAQVEFYLRMQGRDFEQQKAKYVVALSGLLKVKAEEITVSAASSSSLDKVKIDLQVRTNHSSSFPSRLMLKNFQTAFSNAGLPSINSTDTFQIVKMGKNEFSGAPITFFRYLFSPTMSSKLGKCFSSPLRSNYEEAQCQYMDVALWCAMWGIVIVPGVLLLMASALFACSRNLSLLPLFCFSEGHMQVGCLDLFTRVPLVVYSPRWQICSSVLYVCLLVFASCISIIGISSSSQLDFSLVELTSSRRQVLDYPLQRLREVSSQTERLKQSFAADLTSRNKTLELMRGYLDGDWNRTSTLVLGLRSKMKRFALLVEGCKESVAADQCIMSNETLWDFRNLCPLTVNQTNGSLTVRKIGNGTILENTNAFIPNPACKNDDNSNRLCPCCRSCEAVIQSIDKVLSSFSIQPSKSSNSFHFYTSDECNSAIAQLSDLLFNQLKLISTWSIEFYQQTQHIFSSEANSRTLRRVIAYAFWGFVFLTIACLYLSLLLGLQALWTLGKVLILLASLFSWVLWGITSVFVVPQEDMCRLLLPPPASTNSSSVFFLTLQLVDNNLRNTISDCALRPSGDMWSLQKMNILGMQRSLSPLQLYSRVSDDVLSTLMIADYLRVIEPELQTVMDMQATGDEFGYSSRYDPSSTRGQAFKLYLDLLQQQISSMQQDVQSLRSSLDSVKLSASQQRYQFDKMALANNEDIQKTISEMMTMGSCESLTLVYNKWYKNLCEGARNSLESVWIACFVLSITLPVTLLFTYHVAKQSTQRSRDAENPLTNLNVMFDFRRYRLSKRFRMAEARLARDKLRGHRMAKGKNLATLKEPESRATINGNVCTVALGEGVDGWGHASNRGRLPKEELELRVFPEHPKQFSRMEQMMLRGRTEELRLFDPLATSQLNRLKLVSPDQGWKMQYDDRTKALRWVKDDSGDEEQESQGFMTENQKNEVKLLIFHPIDDPQQASVIISKFFYKIDVDASGTIDEQELSKALKTLGLLLSPSDIRAVLREADRRQNGLLDHKDFLSFVFMLNRKIADAKRARDAQVAGEGEAQRRQILEQDQDRPSSLGSLSSPSLIAERQDEMEKLEMTKAIIRQRVLSANSSNDHIYKHQIPEVGDLLGHTWDAQFAQDLLLVCKKEEAISVDEFWGWYSTWLKGKGRKESWEEEGDTWRGTSEISFPNYEELQRMRAKKNLEWHRSLSLQVSAVQTSAQGVLDWWQMSTEKTGG
ncbi:hypothetical protein GUITHDRAFT_106007 [Guillardia theta CCMP2712]|uniref:EF-hand domain-containing protein n=1 Tax=Guillardia theta (strain CCMP2712) TaxID=905079 RepID=L1JIT8_GUITC|nr:hypothetical protein GUITHDRAFT_106007 [Guillardia theta CCMP2712]EKX48401.1 hypothetical protein GUITHDRAFT_106007 [Guillardia theta CCMP2712]|eukprot:XP_005835381.1 hypothetical protein GUITHDRAFT_106007 [Guillardia theta CCMP2712]